MRGKSRLVLLVAATLVALVAGELALRTILFSRSTLRLATALVQYVANPAADDDFHRIFLHLKLRGNEHGPMFKTFDPLLGWTAEPRTPANPLGLRGGMPATLAELRDARVMLFLGDSFTAGVTAPADAIPHRLEGLVPGWTVLNLGVGGYGLDQVYLLLRSVVDDFSAPHVLVGLFYNDIDRLVHRVGPSPKPYFEVEGGELALHGTPIPPDFGRWLELYPAPRKLYVASAVGGLFRRLMLTDWATEHLFAFHPAETSAQRGKKEALTRLLLRAIKDTCDRRGLRLTVVLFPYREHLVHEGWYGPFVRATLAAPAIDYVDLQVPLAERLRDGRTWRTGVYTFFEHPSPEENVFLARAIAAHLKRRYGY
jgi:hypothetical protein